MRQTIIVSAVALIAVIVAVAGAITFIKLDSGESHDAGRAANHTSAPPAQTPAQKQAPPAPRPTVTVTQPPRTEAPPAYGDADANFLAMIAADGIKAPDGWAIEAGNATCGQDYDSAYAYLTDGGLYAHHIQTFLDDWTLTHGGC